MQASSESASTTTNMVNFTFVFFAWPSNLAVEKSEKRKGNNEQLEGYSKHQCISTWLHHAVSILYHLLAEIGTLKVS